MTAPTGSVVLTAGFVALSVAMLAIVSWLLARARDRTAAAGFAAGAGAWAALTYLLADAGVLADFSLPPRLLFVFVPSLLATLAIAGSSWGRALAALPHAWLIGVQAFRVVVELLIHRAATEGVAPPQMSWDGYNLDIVTGVTALPVALLAARLPRAALLAWNALGLALLAVVVTVGLLSMPTPLQRLTPDNTWIAFAPYVWLPTVLVCVAVLLHAVSVRKLLTPAARLAAS